MRRFLLLAALLVIGCSLEPVSLEGRVCRSYLDCLGGQGYFCQPFDAGDGVDGGTAGICVSVSVLDSGVDAAVVPDGGRDAGRDGGSDAGMDAGSDADMDAGSDADIDADIDGGSDAAIDADVDGGSDAAIDAAIDADVDGGSDAGSDAAIDADS